MEFLDHFCTLYDYFLILLNSFFVGFSAPIIMDSLYILCDRAVR